MARFNVSTAVIGLLVAASSTVEAFAPPRPLSTSSFVSTSNTNVAPSSFSSKSTALSMNLFDRFSRVAKSNLNNVLKNLEDPEKIMNQALEDMQVGY